MNIFEYNKDNIKKERFSIKKQEEEKINRIFEVLYADGKFIDILDNKNLDLRKDLYFLFLNDKIKEYCVKGFTNYIFLNAKKDYDFIQKLLLLFIYYSYYYIDKKIQKSINFMEDLFSKKKNGDYLEKKQLLLFIWYYRL